MEILNMEAVKQEILGFFRNPKNRALIYGIFAGIAVIVAGAAVLLITANNSKPNLSEKEKTAIIDEVIKNNSSNILDESIKNQQKQYTPPTTQEIGTPSAQPDLSKYNYRKTEYTSENGPAYNICSFYRDGGFISGIDYSKNYTSTTTEYFEKNRQIIKNFDQNTHSDLYHYMLSDYSNTKSETYDYRGGEYAVKAVYEAYPGFTSDEYLSPISYNNYYSNNPEYQFIGSQTINGKDHYIIQTTYTQFCNGVSVAYISPDSSVNDSLVKIYNLIYVDKETFVVSRRENYINSVSPENLRERSNYKVTTKLTTYNQVANEFVFNYKVDIKTLDYTGYWNLYNPENLLKLSKDYLSDLNISLLTPQGYYMTYLAVTNSQPKLSGSDYSTDRKFYPPGIEADNYLKEITAYLQRPKIELSQSFDVNYGYPYNVFGFHMDTYQQGSTKEDIINSVEDTKYTSLETNEVQINIGNQKVNATQIVITTQYFYIDSYPTVASYLSSYTPYSWKSINYVFEYNGRIYNIYANNDISIVDTQFDVFHSNVSSELNEFYKNLINDFYTNPISYISYPVSYIY